MIDPQIFSAFIKTAGSKTRMLGKADGVSGTLLREAVGPEAVEGRSNPSLVRRLLSDQEDLALAAGGGDNAFYYGRDLQRGSGRDLGKSIVALPRGGVTQSAAGHLLGAKTPEVLAHELGHREWGKTGLGKVLQSTPALLMSRAAGAGGLAAGLAEQTWRNKRKAEGKKTTKIPVGLAVPAAMSMPLLASEAAASILGDRMLRRHGASAETISRGRRALSKAYGTYLLSQGVQGLGGYGVGRYVARDYVPESTKKPTPPA